MLSNDHKALTAKIEQLLHQMHVERVDAQPSHSSAPSHAHIDEGAGMRAFAEIDEVKDGSPAAVAGMLVGDQLLALGNVTATAGGFAALPGLLQVRVWRLYVTLCSSKVTHKQAVEGTPLRALVRRSGCGTSKTVDLQLTPQRWAGRGLLGFHLVPL